MNYDTYKSFNALACPICFKFGSVIQMKDVPEKREAHCETHGVIVSDDDKQIAPKFKIKE